MYVYTNTRTHICMNVHMCMYIHMNTYVYMYMYTYVCICMYENLSRVVALPRKSRKTCSSSAQNVNSASRRTSRHDTPPSVNTSVNLAVMREQRVRVSACVRTTVCQLPFPSPSLRGVSVWQTCAGGHER